MTDIAKFELPSDSEDYLDLPAMAVPVQEGCLPDYSARLYRLYFVVSGASKLTLDKQNHQFRAGQLLALSPHEKATLTGNGEILSLAFHHHFFCVHIKQDEFFCDGVVFNRSQGYPIITLPEKEQALIKNKFDEIRHIVLEKSAFGRDRTISALHSMLLQIAEYKLNDIKADDEASPHRQTVSDLILRFQDLVEIHFKFKRSARFYATILNVTPTTLNRRVKNELGKTTSALINERVATEARKELRSGRKSIKEVAFDLGFEDQLYFSRFFKKHFGTSPRQYFDLKERQH